MLLRPLLKSATLLKLYPGLIHGQWHSTAVDLINVFDTGAGNVRTLASNHCSMLSKGQNVFNFSLEMVELTLPLMPLMQGSLMIRSFQEFLVMWVRMYFC